MLSMWIAELLHWQAHTGKTTQTFFVSDFFSGVNVSLYIWCLSWALDAKTQCWSSLLQEAFWGPGVHPIFFENVVLMPRSDPPILQGGGDSPFPVFCSQAAHKVLHIKLRNTRGGVLNLTCLCSTYKPLIIFLHSFSPKRWAEWQLCY